MNIISKYTYKVNNEEIIGVSRNGNNYYTIHQLHIVDGSDERLTLAYQVAERSFVRHLLSEQEDTGNIKSRNDDDKRHWAIGFVVPVDHDEAWHQFTQAIPLPQQTPLNTLVTQGIAKWPQWEKRIRAAAFLIEENKVQIDGHVVHVHSRSGNGRYTVNGTCPCRDFTYRNICAHSLAARMARKLEGLEAEQRRHVRETALPVEQPRPKNRMWKGGGVDDELEARRKERQECTRAKAEQRATERERKYWQWYNSGDGKRRYMLTAMANGATPVSLRREQPEKFEVAYPMDTGF